MRFSLAILVHQFALLVLGARPESGTAEIDLIIPSPNVTYEVGSNHRFPVVWAIRNPDLFAYISDITWHLDNNTQPAERGGNEMEKGTVRFVYDENDTKDVQDTRYVAVDMLLLSAGSYHLSWQLRSDSFYCNKTLEPDSVSFTTKPGGEKADFMSAASKHCSDWSSMSYNIANTSTGCYDALDRDNPFPASAPCDLKVDVASVTNITQSLNDQYNKTCTNAGLSRPLCPQPAPEKKSLAIRLGAGAWLLGLPLMVLFL